MLTYKQLSVSFDVLLSNYSDIFKDELGMIVEFKAKLFVKPGTISKFCKAQSVSFVIKGTIEGKHTGLKDAGIEEKMTQSDWTVPIVAVPKKDCGFRIGGTTR